MATVTLKVALVGPKSSGKTRIANHLAGLLFPSEIKTEPTIGCRILTFDKQFPTKTREGAAVDVVTRIELWDLSGDMRFEACWPAVADEMHAVIVVFDPGSKQQAQDVRLWCEWFAARGRLQNEQCMIFAHGNLTANHKPLTVKAGGRQLPMRIVNVNLKARTDPEEDAERIVTSVDIEFTKFLGGVYPHHPEADFTPSSLALVSLTTAAAAREREANRDGGESEMASPARPSARPQFGSPSVSGFRTKGIPSVPRGLNSPTSPYDEDELEIGA